MDYTYGAVRLNNGTWFRARLNSETGKVTYMSHQGEKTASGAVSKAFKPNYDSVVNPSNRYRFPDEYNNPNQSFTSAKDAEWRERPTTK